MWRRTRWLVVAAAGVTAVLFGARALPLSTVDLPETPSDRVSLAAPTPREAEAGARPRTDSRSRTGISGANPPGTPDAEPGRDPGA